MGYWKRQRKRQEERETDIEQARAELVSAQKDTAAVNSQAHTVATLASYLAERRELNHFGEALSDSFTPRRRHA